MSSDYHVKAYRPSRFSVRDEADELSLREREANLRKYLLRAQEGLPLFESDPAVRDQSPRPNRMAR